jgi:hypothetical protein
MIYWSIEQPMAHAGITQGKLKYDVFCIKGDRFPLLHSHWLSGRGIVIRALPISLILGI